MQGTRHFVSLLIPVWLHDMEVVKNVKQGPKRYEHIQHNFANSIMLWYRHLINWLARKRLG